MLQVAPGKAEERPGARPGRIRGKRASRKGREDKGGCPGGEKPRERPTTELSGAQRRATGTGTGEPPLPVGHSCRHAQHLSTVDRRSLCTSSPTDASAALSFLVEGAERVGLGGPKAGRRGGPKARRPPPPPPPPPPIKSQ